MNQAQTFFILIVSLLYLRILLYDTIVTVLFVIVTLPFVLFYGLSKLEVNK